MKKSITMLWILFLAAIPTLSAQSIANSSDPCPLVTLPPHAQNLCSVLALIPYPQKAVQAQIEGMVQVRIWVSERGNYLRHQTVQSSHELLSEAVTGYVSQLEFAPAQQNGAPVSACVHLPFIFRLQPKGSASICTPKKPDVPVIVVKGR
ncbi:MAG: energy transducer TonB [Bacteroidota bacterium]